MKKHATRTPDKPKEFKPWTHGAAATIEPASSDKAGLEEVQQRQMNRLNETQVNEEIDALIKPLRDGILNQYRDHLASQGRPLKNPAAPGNGSTGFCVHCDNPVMMGQTYLCRDHIRST